MDTTQKFEVLQDAFSDTAELDLLLQKQLEITRDQYRLKIERYDRDLITFESSYKLDSDTFYERFAEGKMGDDMDYFEWAGLYELRKDALDKISRLEAAL